MAEARDPAIKLFGRTIALPDCGCAADPNPIADPMEDEEKDMCGETTNNEVGDSVLDAPVEVDQGEQNSSLTLKNANEKDHQASATQDVKETPDPKSEQGLSEGDVSGNEKVLKKPDKILPCPRCNSMDTKFCYYNNYNVNQPRHFCKNCQRYWTAGGTMRNVPVGAGRRKNKHSASQYRHIMMSSEGLSSARVDAPDATCQQVLPCEPSSPIRPLKGNGTILKFGPEAPLCESMASALNLGDQKKNAEGTEEPSCTSSMTTSNCVENDVQKEKIDMQGYCNGLTPMHHLQCYPGSPWAYPWSPGWNSAAVAAAAAAAAAAMATGRCSSELVNGPDYGNISSVQWGPPPMVAAPAFCAPTIPIPFVPASFWGPMPGWPNGPWSVPLVGSNGGLSPSSSTSTSGCSGNGSPTLGKHSRDAGLAGEGKTEKSLWVPKTLRIDDPDEAAKSSIWATLGIKPNEGGMFKAFQSKVQSKGQKSDAEQVLHANPAALSRSRSFQEST